MTVKLAKLFGSGNNGAVVGGSTGMGTAGGGGGSGVGTGGKSVSNQMENHACAMDNNKNQEGMPPPLPPPNENMQKFHYKYYDHGIYGHAYMCQDQDMDHDQDEDDYDTALQRNHPYNNSQRPLLGDRRPAVHHNLTLIKMQKPLPPVTPPRPSHSHGNSAAYISPYVQQQKRDSAKGLHGFNDFDALSQEYNRHLQSPHIGYPYGSPPSPTNTSTHHHQHPQQQQQQSSDFCFDHRQLPPPPPSSSSTSSNCSYGHAAMVAASSSSSSSFPSRFEDDFCKRNNSETSGCNLIGTSGGGGGNGANGPFIFGISHVVGQSRDYGCTVIDSSATSPARQVLHHNDTQQSLSDTSADSSSGKGAKFLLRKRKSKKTQTASAATTGPATASTKEERKGPPSIKCVLVGDGAVGKTNLILSYLENRFQAEHVPTASDIYNADVNVNDSPVHLTLCDTAGQDTLDPLRELCYPDSDVFLLCFSVVKPETFRAIKSKWAPKFAKSTAALILVGTQADLRANPNVLNKLQTNGEKAISYADAWDLATTIGAKYIETSSATQDKVKDVFDAAIWEGLVPTTLPPTPSFWRKLFCLA
ncbi:uncharacterized protein RhoU isoform X1 [Drosophila tropicalis]|uniref:uncharacterized protein RhoU isoform X1 n=1 Tax=Drosophila tropicalis TaxID=46794 RepID=UPI0035ABD49D